LQEQWNVVRRVSGQHDGKQLRHPRLPITVQEFAEHRSLGLRASILLRPNVGVPHPPEYGRGHDDDEVGTPHPVEHPGIPVPSPVGGSLIQFGVNSVAAQEGGEFEYQLFVRFGVVGVRHEHPGSSVLRSGVPFVLARHDTSTLIT
jgi:hypothetical protein